MMNTAKQTKAATVVTSGDWELVWSNYIAALRSGSPTRIAAAKAEMEAVKREIG